MQITVPREEMKEALTGLNRVVPSRVTLPVLGCVRFESGAKGVTALTTDLDQTLRYRFGGAIAEGQGTFIVPLASLKDLAHGKPQESVEFETTNGATVFVTNHVGSNAIRHPLNGLPPDEWPVVPEEVPTSPATGFLETYRRLVPFASTDSTRFVLNAVYVEVAESGEHPVTMIATDGRRLSLWNTMNLPLSSSIIVPITRLLQWPGLEGDVELGLRTERQKDVLRVLALCLNAGPWGYDLKLVEGAYPNFRHVLPGAADGTGIRIQFAEEDVATLGKLLATFPGSGSMNSAIALRPGPDGRLIIAGRNPDDQAETTLELSGGSRFEGKAPAVGVNCFYLLDALRAGFRTFTSSDELCPLRSDDGRGGIHVLMPLKLDGVISKKGEPKDAAGKEKEATPPPQDEASRGEGSTEAAGVSAASPPPQEEPQTGASASESAEVKDKKGGRKTMAKEGEANGTGTTEHGTALDKVLAAVDTAKTKLRESAAALADVAEAVKLAAREGKAQTADLEKARATLQKLQAINL